MSFAENLRFLKDSLNLTNYRFAKELQCSQTAVKSWLDGSNLPHTKTRVKIAEYFGISLEALDGDDLPALPVGSPAPTPTQKNTAVPQDDGQGVYIDYQAGRIRSAHPIAVLAAQYSVPSAVMQNIAECDPTHAQALCIGLSDPTPEELSKIARVFRISLDDLSQGWVSLSTNQGVHDDIALRRSYRFPSQVH